MSNQEFVEEYPINSEVDYHGDTGKIKTYDGTYAIIYFTSIDDEIAIDIEELVEQNF